MTQGQRPLSLFTSNPHSTLTLTLSLDLNPKVVIGVCLGTLPTAGFDLQSEFGVSFDPSDDSFPEEHISKVHDPNLNLDSKSLTLTLTQM